jgi:hypothetical protein
MLRFIRVGVVTTFVLTIALLTPSVASAADNVIVAGQSHVLNGVNIYRSTNFLVEYTPAKGATTGTNSFGYEAAVVGGRVTSVADGVGNMAIPANGVVLSGHGTSRTFLKTYAVVGATVVLPGGTPPPPPPPPGGTALLPDLGIRTLRQFTINTTARPGVKQLKFPAVTSNVGAGPFEIHGTRASTTSTGWTATQTLYNTNGSKTTLPAPGATFFFAGDGHSHWHVRDLDSYELLNASGTRVRVGEKHGFCFEDNTSYRDWPGNPKHPGAPLNPVYVPANVCGVGQPNALVIMHGLSVGWSDTYPATLPDQFIDITGIPNGRYRAQVTADWADWFKESNENNNFSWADITISGNTVTLNATGGGL